MAVGCEEPLPRVRLFLLLLLLSSCYTSARERKRRAVRDPYARSPPIFWPIKSRWYITRMTTNPRWLIRQMFVPSRSNKFVSRCATSLHLFFASVRRHSGILFFLFLKKNLSKKILRNDNWLFILKWLTFRTDICP